MTRQKNHLIVDGYNMIHRWRRFRASPFDKANFEVLRDALIQTLREYQATQNIRITVVFDAACSDQPQHVYKEHHIDVIYTGVGQSADAVIERLVFQHHQVDELMVASSDRMIQTLCHSHGALRLSAEELEKNIDEACRETKNVNRQRRGYFSKKMAERVPPELEKKLRRMSENG